jgi:FlaA1/EpsC-like NDP-sugar epimerase
MFLEYFSNLRADGYYTPTNILRYVFNFLLFYALVFVARYLLKIYNTVWKYADSRSYLELIVADASGGVVALLLSRILNGAALGGWHSVAVMTMFNCASIATRLAYQQWNKYFSRQELDRKDNRIPVAIVGAGQVGAILADELLNHRSSRYRPVCFIDNNTSKVGTRVIGIPVLSDSDKTITYTLKDVGVQEIFIAIPDLSKDRINELFNRYTPSGCKVKLYDFYRNTSGEKTVNEKRVIRDFNIEDLLFRKRITVTDDKTSEFYKNKTVLITGGGGSIGSELARQIAACHPKRLVIVDIYENNAYEIQQELVRQYGKELDLVVEIGSVRDRTRLEAIFSYHRPNVVFHAAAHKHVPLMERSNCEAIKNNCLGTYNTADMAEKYKVEKFILISTDKAVNPTNVMGASKRMCEMIVQCRNDGLHDTEFSAVRFGNVLGSNGSVIPLFKKQIAEGGPVTVTDKRITRYFMLIPEAAGLVMEAGAKATRGELFVLDMGDSIEIYKLATDMIKLSGFIPDVDIEIKEIGLRPGEKLYEELLIKTEDLTKTDNELIFIETDTPLTRKEVEDKLKKLKDAVIAAENEVYSERITEVMKEVIPTFKAPNEVNDNVSKSNVKEAKEPATTH